MPWITLLVAILALVFGPGLWVRRVMARYSRPGDRYEGTGGELARHLLDQAGLQHVRVEETDQGDHYDPREKAVRLMPDKLRGRSLTAVTVAAHEVGHALQDAEGYPPLRLRTRMVESMQHIQRLGAGILVAAPFIGLLTRAPQITGLMFIGGFLSLATATVVHLLTLPTEFDASFNRALPLLQRGPLLHRVDLPHARRLLRAAALTYVSASLMSLLNIARWWALLRR
ncbi:MAG: peptidase [Xanthomonadales bacterium]|nr:peptidase [Xanthomonadales bacterium]NIN59243.1 peptidase [Xanthomonadales bacterium]NIN74594.1 peptidase [Xanthomonadales bacterium]NIO12541.1 peptidase [Xanthomonadales bacterium]NIP11636.1 peptidase [Xanthomonadales bacterium]